MFKDRIAISVVLDCRPHGQQVPLSFLLKQRFLLYSSERKCSGRSEESWEDTKLLYVFPFIWGNNLSGFRTLGYEVLSKPKSHYRLLNICFYLIKAVLCLTAIQLCCGLQGWGQYASGIFCVELPHLKAKHLLNAFWIHSRLLLRQRIRLVQSFPSLFLSQHAVKWFSSSSYAPSLILLASAPV